MVAHCLFDRAEHFNRETHPLLGVAAIAITALVRERRNELVEQIAMSHMQLDGIETGFDSASCRSDEFGRDAIHIVPVHFALQRTPEHQADLVDPATG